jgi:hypothetical protein
VEKSGEIGLEGIQGYSNKNCIFLGWVWIFSNMYKNNEFKA